MTTRHGDFLAFAGRYATRSLWRSKRRTVLTIGTVTLSVAVSIIAVRYTAALMKIWADGSVDHGSGHAQLHQKGYDIKPDVVDASVTMADGQPVEELLRQDPAVAATSHRLTFEGIIASGAKAVYFLGQAVSPEDELKVCPEVFVPSRDEGRFVTSDAPNGVVLGRGLAATLGLKIGDEATLMTNTVAGGANGVDVQVIGLVTPPLVSLSKRLVYLHLAAGQRTIRLGGRYSELAIRLKPGVIPEEWVASFQPKAAAANLSLKGWWDIDPIIRRVERIWDSVVGVISALLFVSAAISVLNIVFLMVAERTVEIGTLMALGARSRDIRTLFTLEAGLIGLLGGLGGALLGDLYIFVIGQIGVPFESPFGGRLIVHPTVAWPTTLWAIGGGILICYLAALAPSRRAASVEPVTAFKGQIT